jgi:hypothetical protein
LLIEEEEQVRNADRRYWMRLKKELEPCATLASHAQNLDLSHLFAFRQTQAKGFNHSHV